MTSRASIKLTLTVLLATAAGANLIACGRSNGQCGPGSGTNRSIGVLAAPVFYSLFDDLARNRVWSRIGGGFSNTFGRARRRAATAAASLLGITTKQ